METHVYGKRHSYEILELIWDWEKCEVIILISEYQTSNWEVYKWAVFHLKHLDKSLYICV